MLGDLLAANFVIFFTVLNTCRVYSVIHAGDIDILKVGTLF